MGDQPTTNGQAVTDLARMRDSGRLAFEAAFKSGGELEDAAKPAEPEKPAPVAVEAKPENKPATPASPKKPEPVDDFDDDDDDDDEPDEFDDPPEAPADPDVRRRIAQVQRQEAHAREQLARERAELERRERAIAEAEAKSKPRSKHEVVELLEELGLDDDEWGILAKRAHARSKEGKADPKWREQADREAAGKRTHDDVKSLRAELDELKEANRKRDESERTQKHLDRYFDRAVKGATDDSLLFKRHLSADPDDAQRALAAIAHEGLERKGKLPDEAKLIKIYERRRRADLERFGVDVDALIGKKTTKEQSLAAAKEHAATTTSTTSAATSANGAGAADRKAQRAHFLTAKEVD